MNVENRIASLASPEIADRIPSFTRKHAIACSCRLIARDYPELYQAFAGEEEPDDEIKGRMARILDDILVQRSARRHS